MKKTISTLLLVYNDDKIKPLNIMLPKISAYVKSYDGYKKVMILSVLI